MIFPSPKNPDGRTPEAVFQQRVTEALTNQARLSTVQGMRVCRTTRGSYAIPEMQSGGSSGGAVLGPYALYDVYGDYLVCRKYDPAADSYGPPNIFIAKEPKHRESLTAETILGEDHTYTFDDGPTESNWEVGESAAFNRQRTDAVGVTADNPWGTKHEYQQLVPPWRYDEQIYAVQATVWNEVQTGTDEDGNPVVGWQKMQAVKLNDDGTEANGSDGNPVQIQVKLLIVGRSSQWAGYS